MRILGRCLLLSLPAAALGVLAGPLVSAWFAANAPAVDGVGAAFDRPPAIVTVEPSRVVAEMPAPVRPQRIEVAQPAPRVPEVRTRRPEPRVTPSPTAAPSVEPSVEVSTEPTEPPVPDVNERPNEPVIATE